MACDNLNIVEPGDFLQCCDGNEYFEVSFIVEMKGYDRKLGDISIRKFYFKNNKHRPATEPFITAVRLKEEV